VTEEQRSHRPKGAQPAGRPCFLAQASLFAPHRRWRVCSSLTPRRRLKSLAANVIVFMFMTPKRSAADAGLSASVCPEQ
jgi:hypothetical protein